MERKKTKVYVILPAAGTGQRFGAPLPKQVRFYISVFYNLNCKHGQIQYLVGSPLYK